MIYNRNNMDNLPAYKALDVFWSIITLTRKIFITNDIKDSYFLFIILDSFYQDQIRGKQGGSFDRMTLKGMSWPTESSLLHQLKNARIPEVAVFRIGRNMTIY